MNCLPPMSVLDLITELQKVEDQDLPVYINLCSDDSESGSIVTSDFEGDSWRGAYDYPSIGYESNKPACSVKRAITELSKIEGMKVTGYKGGDFILSEDDTLFIANYGESNNHTAPISIEVLSDLVIIHTAPDMY